MIPFWCFRADDNGHLSIDEFERFVVATRVADQGQAAKREVESAVEALDTCVLSFCFYKGLTSLRFLFYKGLASLPF